MTDDLVLELRGVSKHFGASSVFDRRPPVQAVTDVTLSLPAGQRLAIVGESGSGKTTLARTLLGMTKATAGEIRVAGIDVASRASRLQLRRAAQLVHQDPHGSLSPRQRVGSLLAEPYKIHKVSPSERWSPEDLLHMVGLNAELAAKYPHELSGGQARRVGIARALALRPQLLVADEPTSGLDVSAAGGVLNLMHDLSKSLSISYILVTHNLNTVGYAADRIAVMYLGTVVEEGPVGSVLSKPAHPYTEALMAAIPAPDPATPREGTPLSGEVPSARTPPSGCRFHTRCPLAFDRCTTETPQLKPVADDRRSACHIADDVLAKAK